MSCQKKVALVTGSTSGIGLACAHILAKRGIDLIITGSRDVSLVQETLNEFKRYDIRVDYVSADLSKVEHIDILWSEVTRLYPDGVDILINNAGLQYRSFVENYPDDKWDLLIAVMLTAPFHLTKRCLPGMKKKGWGRIVNMSSCAGLIAFPQAAVYSTAKHGLMGLTKGVALENAKYGITCNAVCPAFVLTALQEKNIARNSAESGISKEDYVKNFLLRAMPTGKLITEEQVAELVEFLCLSNASSQMTGGAYLIDGGATAQ